MQTATILSHLTPLQWKKAWSKLVVEDTPEGRKASQQMDCFWGHFTSESDFVICHHREFELKSLSVGLYFTGHIERDPQGCRITGTFGKKRSANLFLGMGAILCILALLGSIARKEYQILVTALVLLIILLLIYFVKPQKGQEQILEHLKKLSFD